MVSELCVICPFIVSQICSRFLVGSTSLTEEGVTDLTLFRLGFRYRTILVLINFVQSVLCDFGLSIFRYGLGNQLINR